MSAKTMLLMLVLLPAASALGTEPLDATLGTPPAAAVLATGVVDEAADTVGDTAETVGSVLRCRDAVEVPVRGWGGTFGDERTREHTWVDVREVQHRAQTGTEPVIEVRQELIWTPPGPVGAVLDPVVREHEVVVGERPVHAMWTEERSYRIDAAWTDRFLEWERVAYHVLLTPAAGLPHLASGGALVQVCDDTPLHDVIAEPDGYDRWSLVPQRDRWVRTFHDIDVRPVADAGALTERRNVRHCPLDLLAEADRAVDSLVAEVVETGAMGARGSTLAPGDIGRATGDGADAGPSAGFVVPSGTGVTAGAWGAMVLAALGAALWRRG